MGLSKDDASKWPSISFISRWAKKHDLAVRVPKLMEPERVEACKVANLLPWFSKVEREVGPKIFHVKMIFNFDETMLEIDTKLRMKVVVPKELKYPKKVQKAGIDSHITMGLCISADGGHVKPLVILPLSTFPKDCLDIADGYFWAGQNSGWMTEEIFQQWVEIVFVPHVNDIRDQHKLWDEPALLYLDGHSSRCSEIAINYLRDNNVVAVTIPSHTSHILQPLDTGVNGEFKVQLAKVKRFPSNATAADKRRILLKAALKALHIAFYSDNVKCAFAKSGLYPWNPQRILGDPNLTSRDEPLKTCKSSRSSASMSGKILTSDDVLHQVVATKGKMSS